MQKTLRTLAAAIVGASVLVAPTNALADDGMCDKYDQVRSNATGGDWVGGLLFYETTGSVTRDNGGTSETKSATAGVSGGGVSGSGTASQTTTAPTTTTTTEEPIGYYAMNDGSIYQINCLTGEARRVG